jgi:ribosomal-protein-alanine N-acetyltransferase
MNYKSFETQRLIIRPTVEKDAEFILQLFNTPKWITYIGDRHINTVKEAKEYIKDKMIAQLKKQGFSTYTLLTKKDHHKIGTCGLYDREGLEGIDIGFAMLPAYEGCGFAFEASRRLLMAAFDDFGLEFVSGITTKDNITSKKLLEKLGFTFIGLIKISNDTTDNEDLLLYRIEK